jgi:hypothetical protein
MSASARVRRLFSSRRRRGRGATRQRRPPRMVRPPPLCATCRSWPGRSSPGGGSDASPFQKGLVIMPMPSSYPTGIHRSSAPRCNPSSRFSRQALIIRSPIFPKRAWEDHVEQMGNDLGARRIAFFDLWPRSRACHRFLSVKSRTRDGKVTPAETAFD